MSKHSKHKKGKGLKKKKLNNAMHMMPGGHMMSNKEMMEKSKGKKTKSTSPFKQTKINSIGMSV